MSEEVYTDERGRQWTRAELMRMFAEEKTPPAAVRVPNTDPQMSARPCGCDPAEAYVARDCMLGCISVRGEDSPVRARSVSFSCGCSEFVDRYNVRTITRCAEGSCVRLGRR